MPGADDEASAKEANLEEEDQWDSEEEEEYLEGDEFPIGYTIEFSPEPDLNRSEPQAARGGLGSQALPVSNQLRADWDGVPVDGAEYLFTVRQQARSIPRVVVKPNPYELNKIKRPISTQLNPPPSSGSGKRPSKAWKDQFLVRFKNMRKSLENHEPFHWELETDYQQIPSSNDESNWKIFIFGKKLDLAKQSAKEPIPIFLKALEQAKVIAILSHYQTWINERIKSLISLAEGNEKSKLDSENLVEPQNFILLSGHDGSWLLGLLSVLDSVLTAEDIYKLRELARACKQVATIAGAALDLENSSSEDTAQQEAAIAWMVLAAITDVWGQKDLWED